MKIPQVHVKKLDDCSKSVIYLGKEPGTKENLLFDLVYGAIHVSRDVVFQEDKIWLWEQQTMDHIS